MIIRTAFSTLGRREKMTNMTTLCYIEQEGKYLMLHRIAKENDINKDKWIGVGGHFEENESPEECLLRELTLQRLKHIGFLCTSTSQYTRKYIRLMNFHKTFITKNTSVSINDNIRLVSKPIYIFFLNCYTA